MRRRDPASGWCPVLVCILAAVLGACAGDAADAPAHLVDLEGRPVDPLADSSGAVSVFLFVASECPVANRYAPIVQQLHEEFGRRGVLFWMIYPDSADTPESIRAHLGEYGYPGRVLRDPAHQLVHRTGATVTPEAVVFDTRGRQVYRGRIDDRYLAFGKVRPSPTRNDLQIAVSEVLEGKPVSRPETPAVGCFIGDLR